MARGEEEKKNEVGEGRRGEKKKQGSPSAMATFSFSNFGLKLGAGHAAFAGASAPCWTFISLAGIASGSEPALGSPLARAKKRGKASRRRPAAPPGVSGITPEGLAFMTSPGELDAVFLVVLEEEEVLAASSRCRRGDLGGKRKGGKKNSLSLSLSHHGLDSSTNEPGGSLRHFSQCGCSHWAQISSTRAAAWRGWGATKAIRRRSGGKLSGGSGGSRGG